MDKRRLDREAPCMKLSEYIRTAFAKSTLSVLLIFIFSSDAHSFTFKPSDAEWASWPQYCQSRYVQTTVGRRHSKFAGSIPQQTINKWKRIVGPTFVHVHHYCEGMIYLKRADLSVDERKKKRVYQKAVNAIDYTYERAGRNFILFSQMSAHLAMAHSGVGNTAKAISILQNAINRQPDKPEAYIQLAKMAAATGDEEEAVKILKRGLSSVRYKSYLLHVKLARIYLEKEEYESAKYHADKAYATGYRSPGLKRKIARANNQTNGN